MQSGFTVLVCCGRFATLSEFKQGLAVTGSPCDAFSSEPWVVRLRQLLAAAVRRGQRVLGMCFGCQVVAVALQGSAGEWPMPPLLMRESQQ